MSAVPDLGWIFRRPMLAYSDTLPFEQYRQHLPLLGSYKLDGIRGIQKQNLMISRTLTKFRSLYCHSICHPEYEHFDGEFVIKPREIPVGETIYHLTYSAIMTGSSTEPLDWWVFDYAFMISPDYVYSTRYALLKSILDEHPHPDIRVLEQRWLETPEQIAAMEKEALDAGYEGLIVRRPDSPYHCNRSSFKQGYLMKIVRTLTASAKVTGFTEMEHNLNEATIDARGFTKRSSHTANKVGKGMLGAFWVEDLETGCVFKVGIGEGIDHAMRLYIWEHQSEFLGKIMDYTFKPYGTKDAPRQPKWYRWRDPSDVGVPT